MYIYIYMILFYIIIINRIYTDIDRLISLDHENGKMLCFIIHFDC